MRKSFVPGRRFSRQLELQSRTASKTAAIAAAAAASLVGTRLAPASITATWTDGNATQNWSDAANWNAAVPGDDSGGTTNTDTAVFNQALTNNAVNLDTANWNIQNIVFDTNTGIFGIGSATTGNSLLLTNGGAITVTSATTVNGTMNIAAPVLIEGNSYSFVDNAPSTVSGTVTFSTGLNVSNSISGAVSGTTNLILDGTGTGGNFGNSIINGAISNGAATTLNLVKQGAGTWQVGNTASPSVINSYTGSTTINGGTLRVLSAGGLPSTTDVTVNGTTSVLSISTLSSAPVVIHSLLLENMGNNMDAGETTDSLDAVSILNNTGAAWTWDATTTTGITSIKLSVNFTGTVAGEGGFTLINGPSTPTQRIDSHAIVNLGSVSRIFNIPSGGQSIATPPATANSTDFQFNGTVTSTGGGFIKTGNGILKLNAISNTFTGPIEIQQGQFKLVGTVANPLIGTNQLLVDGGTLNINANNATFGAATFTSGGTSFSTATPGAEIIAPSFTFTVSNAASFAMNNVMADDGSPSAVLVNGSGTAVFNNANLYTGGTTVSSGVLVLNGANAGAASVTGTGNITMNGGILQTSSGAPVLASGNVIAGTGSHTLAPGGLGVVGTLSVGGLTSSSLTTLNFDLGTGTGTITNGDNLLLGSGTVSIGSGTKITIGGTPVAGNDYQLIGGTIGGINLANFSLPTAPAGLAYNLASAGGFIDLDVIASGPSSLTWNNGGADNLWNTTSSNWNNGSSNTTYSDGAQVTFNDSNPSNTTANYNVTLNTTVSPGSVAVNNSNGNYVIGGTGSIAGTTSVSKAGSGKLTLNTVNTYTGGTNVSAGTLVAGVAGALPSGAVSITGGTLQLATSIGGVTLTSLAISGSGTLDINNNHIIINYGAGPDPIASVIAMLNAGFNSGAWNGPGGINSSAIATTTGYSIGYADSADAGNPASLASGTLEVAFTLLGDANLDHAVNGVDFGILAANFNKGVTGWDKGDFNYDNAVNGVDFGDLAANFNKGAASAADIAALDAFAAANGLLADVPEPASIGLLAAGACGLMARRRRK